MGAVFVGALLLWIPRVADALELADGGAREGLESLGLLDVDAGGKVEVLRLVVVVLGAMICLDRALTPETGLFPGPAGGVDVRDVAVLDVPLVPSCLVGDLAGDCIPLANLLAGVGVFAAAVPVRAGPPCKVCLLVAFAVAPTPLGLLLVTSPLLAGFALGRGSSRT